MQRRQTQECECGRLKNVGDAGCASDCPASANCTINVKRDCDRSHNNDGFRFFIIPTQLVEILRDR